MTRGWSRRLVATATGAALALTLVMPAHAVEEPGDDSAPTMPPEDPTALVAVPVVIVADPGDPWRHSAITLLNAMGVAFLLYDVTSPLPKRPNDGPVIVAWPADGRCPTASEIGPLAGRTRGVQRVGGNLDLVGAAVRVACTPAEWAAALGWALTQLGVLKVSAESVSREDKDTARFRIIATASPPLLMHAVHADAADVVDPVETETGRPPYVAGRFERDIVTVRAARGESLPRVVNLRVRVEGSAITSGQQPDSLVSSRPVAEWSSLVTAELVVTARPQAPPRGPGTRTLLPVVPILALAAVMAVWLRYRKLTLRAGPTGSGDIVPGSAFHQPPPTPHGAPYDIDAEPVLEPTADCMPAPPPRPLELRRRPAPAIAAQSRAGWVGVPGAIDLETDQSIPPMPVGPAPAREASDRGRAWAAHGSRVLGLAMYFEKKRDAGEDGEPSLLVARSGERALAGVYDGLGGAGSADGAVDEAGHTYTQAFVASRLVRGVVEQRFLEDVAHGRRFDVVRLENDLRDEMAAVREEFFDSTRSAIVSNLQRTLPTTLAVADITPGPRRTIAVTAAWAGDSRVYVLSTAAGLQQLSIDDVRDPDVLRQLVNDSPMKNIVSASAAFSIRVNEVDVPAPAVVVCATDGVFGYVATPGQTEHVLLDTLAQAPSLEVWGQLLHARIRDYTKDDATISIVAVGWRRFSDVQRAFAPRTAIVSTTQDSPFRELADGDRAAFVEARSHAWEQYRDPYLALVPKEAVEASAEG
jgi:serine/threonine protein phosphatase PrpC